MKTANDSAARKPVDVPIKISPGAMTWLDLGESEEVSMEREIAWGALINGALYFSGCFVAGLVLNVHLAVALSLAGAGAAFVSYTLAFNGRNTLAPFVSMGSLVLGVGAGLSLIFV